MFIVTDLASLNDHIVYFSSIVPQVMKYKTLPEYPRKSVIAVKEVTLKTHILV